MSSNKEETKRQLKNRIHFHKYKDNNRTEDELNNDDNNITNNTKNYSSINNKNFIYPKYEVSVIDDVMYIIFLGIGASSLSIAKVPYYISLILTIFVIASIGIINIYFGYYNTFIYILNSRLKNKNKEIKNEIKMDFCKCINYFNIPFIICEIIIHQILIYRSLGGIVNIIGEFNYDTLFIFLSDTYWRELSMKFVVNIIIFFFYYTHYV